MKTIITIIFLFVATICYGQENIPAPAAQTQDEEIKNLSWNKWETNNFIILSLDKNQGLYLKNNIEKIKTEAIIRWGLKDVDFSSKCKIICTTNKNLLKKLFKLENSHNEVRKDENGKINLNAFWFSFEENPDGIIRSGITSICLSEIEQNQNISIPLFCKNGMSVLNQKLSDVISDLSRIKVSDINLKEMLTKKYEDLLKDTDENVDIYKKQSAVLCLLFRKEFGQSNFVNYLFNNNFESFGIKSEEDLSKILNRYNENLVRDLNNKKVPDDYLQINRR